MRAAQDIDVLISKFLSGEASPEEAMQLEDWKAESSENQRYYEISAGIFGLTEEMSATEEAWQQVRQRLKKEKAPVRRLPMLTPMRVAAAISVLAVLSVLIWLGVSGGSETAVFTAASEQKKVRLDDGTAITIAANSSIELDKGYGKNNRYLKLNGSGYFSVKHSRKLPFVIDAGPIRIKDLGTKFDVSATKDTIYVRVDEGVVMIYDNSGLKITLKANQSAYYVISSGKLEVEVQVPDAKGEKKTYVFDSQPLSKVVERLNELYGEEILIENPKAAGCRITIQFSDEDPELVLDVIAETLGLKVEHYGNQYWLKGTCTK